MWMPWRRTQSSSPLPAPLVAVDFLDLCKRTVRAIEDLADDGDLLNHRQCLDLSSKLSQTTRNIRDLLSYGRASADLFRPALEYLYLCLAKAELLVSQCGEDDWCAAAVFQCQNENAFRGILLEVGLCYNVIYEQAKSAREEWSVHPEDLRQSKSVFGPASDSDVDEDKRDLRKRLDELANDPSLLKDWNHSRLREVKQSLARYLLVKMDCTALETRAKYTLDTYSAILWRKASEPSGTWGRSRSLVAGAGRVLRTEWLDIPCARKEFHEQESENLFLKEAGIMAHLKHPCIVNFICCGNGLERGDRFIAMELMEKSLHGLIEDQKGVPFSLLVAVDMMVQMARGVCYLHGGGVAHRDLKSHNVVVNRVTTPHLSENLFCVKLVDFGLSMTEVEAFKLKTTEARGIGTTRYRAPEVYRNADGGQKVNWLKVDAFSFAMTCAHLLSLKVPFEDLNRFEVYEAVRKQELRPELPEMCPPELVALLNDCWKTNPRSRPYFVEVCTRLETLRYKLLRGISTLNRGLVEDQMDLSTGFDFIKMKVAEQSSFATTLPEVLKTNCAQCDTVVKVYHAFTKRILKLQPVVLQFLEAASSDQRNDAAESLSLIFYSLAEIERCMQRGTIYTLGCAIDPDLVSIDHSNARGLLKMAYFLLRDFSFCLDLVQVAFNRFMFELKLLDISGSPVGLKISKDIAEGFVKNELCGFFEWCGTSCGRSCGRNCRPVLKQSFVDLGEHVVQHPSKAKELYQELGGLTMDHASPWIAVLEEQSAEPSDFVPETIDYRKEIQEGHHLGHGAYGAVLSCKWRTKERVVKIIQLSPQWEEVFEKEVSILSSFQHPNAVQIFGYGYRKGKAEGFILMERMEMDLSNLIEEAMKGVDSPVLTVFPLDITLDMMFQIVEGLCYLKEKGVIHRDIKPGNILVNRPDKGKKPLNRLYHLKLADFGTSKVNELNSVFKTVRLGTPSYMAPEINVEGTGNQSYSFKADVYSFGMVCSEILTGKRPFQHLNGHLGDTLKAVQGGERPDLPLDRGDPLRRLIEDCWNLNPDSRPNIWQVRQRLWKCRVHNFSKITKGPPMSWASVHTDLYSRFEVIRECQNQMSGLLDIVED